MTTVDIDAIRTRAEAATPGPWFTDGKWFHPWEVCINANRPLIEMEDTTQGIADAGFIAHAREDIPALLGEVERLRAELDRQQQAHGETVDKVMADGWTRVADEFDAAVKAGA